MSTRPRILDLFSGAGGAAVGYHRAGFDVLGVDINPQPRYPFEFHQADALEFVAEHGHRFDAIHASPPCQLYTSVNRIVKLKGRTYPDLVAPTREVLSKSGKSWVIENVAGSPLKFAARVCGSAFGLDVRRHRYFEGSFVLFSTPCYHARQDKLGARFPSCFQSRKALNNGRRHLSTVVQVYGHTGGKALWPAAMGIDWMTSKELTQAIPPAFTEYIGKQLMEVVR